MSTNPPTPLTPREREALDRFEQWVNGRDDPKPRERVIEHLTAGEFSIQMLRNVVQAVEHPDMTEDFAELLSTANVAVEYRVETDISIYELPALS